MVSIFSSFCCEKTPMWPVHTWLPDAQNIYCRISFACSYFIENGWIWIYKIFNWTFFPNASEYFVPLILYSLSLIAIIYTSLVALMQEDMKKLIAYSSVAHMGFVTMGIFTITNQGIEGSIFQMLSHG